MKSIKITVQVPSWAKWKATDNNGEMYIYELEPKKMPQEYIPSDVMGKYKPIMTLEDSGEWEKSKHRI